MPELTSAQYFTVYNLLSLAIASMMATFVFFALVRTEVSLKYRGAVSAGAMVVFIAAYHYFRIFSNWEAAYHINAGGRLLAHGPALQPCLSLRRLAAYRAVAGHRTRACLGFVTKGDGQA